MEGWGKAAESFGRTVESVGPWGALLIALAVGLVVGLALLAHFKGLFQGQRGDRQSLDFVDRLIAEVDKLSTREAALRAELERTDIDRDGQRLRAVELQADVELMRAQLRRAIEQLRAVREGRLAPSAINETDLAEWLKK